jgi:hypothetical protein
MKFSIQRKELKAMSRFSSTKDIRYYLCGIHIVQNNRGTYLESTNGHIMGRLLIDDEPKPQNALTIGNDAIKSLIGTAKNANEILHFTVDGVKIHVITPTGEHTFQALDGNFPDCDRVLPLVLKDEDIAPACYNPEYVLAFHQAAQDIKGTKKGANPTVSILQRGNHSGLVNIGVSNFIGVIMPMRDGGGVSIPQWCFKPTVKPVETETATA